MTTFSNQSLMRNKYYNWIIKNLFSSWVNSLMTVVAIIFIYEVGTFFLNWAFFAADFRTNFQGELIMIDLSAQRILCLESTERVGQLFMLGGISLCMDFILLKKYGG